VHNTASMTSLVFHGTSFSAPLVAGGVALLLEEDPARDVTAVRQILRDRAQGNAYTGNLPNEVWGYGILNLDPAHSGAAHDVGAVREQPLRMTAAPNPFNPSTVISISGVKLVAASLRVFDMRGRMVADLTGALRRSAMRGEARVEWNAAGLASGIYVVRLDGTGFTLTRSLVLIR
jgi:hypothetical protein